MANRQESPGFSHGEAINITRHYLIGDAPSCAGDPIKCRQGRNPYVDPDQLPGDGEARWVLAAAIIVPLIVSLIGCAAAFLPVN